MGSRILAVALVMFSLQVKAFDPHADFKGFVSIGKKELYVDYLAPQPGKQTIVLLNGLTYNTTSWDKMMVPLKKTGLGVLRYDMDGMGRTLTKYGYPSEPIQYIDQVQDLNKLLTVTNLPLPYNIVGLSYGGGIAAVYGTIFPQKIRTEILMAPYTQALAGQDTWIKQQIAFTRSTFPFNSYSDDAIYDYYLKQIVYTTYPAAEPVVLEQPFTLESVFRMTQGIRKLNVVEEVSRFPKTHSVYLVIAENDQYIPRQVHEDFWTAIPAAAQGEKFYIKNSEHKMPEAQPVKSAELVDQIVSKER